MTPARTLLWTLLRPYRGQASLALLLLLAVTGLFLTVPGWSATLIRDVFPRADMIELTRHLALGILIIAAAGALSVARDYLVYRIVHRVTASLRERLFEHVLSLPLPRIARAGSGDLIARFSAEIDIVQQGLNHGLTLLLPGLVVAVIFVVAMFTVSWRLSLATLLMVVTLVGAIVFFERHMRSRTHRARSAVTRLMTVWADVLRGIREVKSFVREAEMGRRLGERSRATRTAEFDQDLVTAIHPAAVMLLTAIGVMVLIYFGTFMLQRGWVTSEDLARFVPCLFIAVSGLQDVGRTVGSVSRLLAILDRFNVLLEDAGEAEEDRALPRLPRVSGTVSFVDVCFRYGTDGFELGPLSVTISAEETIALVGPSGAGKSTILDLVCRFRDPDSGRIEVDGLDTRLHRRDSLRGQIGLVPQEPILFEGTLLENIRFGKLDATDEEISRAARWAHVEEFADALPQGYDTKLGGTGVSLSVGQRQRVAIARALLLDPPILLLDEPTSALDAESERLVRDALAHACRGRTTLIVAHRLSTISHVDRILVFDRGKLVEDDTHERLLDRRGLYHLLHSGQVLP